jgi:hypothetical protein
MQDIVTPREIDIASSIEPQMADPVLARLSIEEMLVRLVQTKFAPEDYAFIMLWVAGVLVQADDSAEYLSNLATYVLKGKEFKNRILRLELCLNLARRLSQRMEPGPFLEIQQIETYLLDQIIRVHPSQRRRP